MTGKLVTGDLTEITNLHNKNFPFNSISKDIMYLMVGMLSVIHLQGERKSLCPDFQKEEVTSYNKLCLLALPHLIFN